jgi:MFS-type transporter involved in bile tolerance (Atg22 family)
LKYSTVKSLFKKKEIRPNYPIINTHIALLIGVSKISVLLIYGDLISISKMTIFLLQSRIALAGGCQQQMLRKGLIKLFYTLATITAILRAFLWPDKTA